MTNSAIWKFIKSYGIVTAFVILVGWKGFIWVRDLSTVKSPVPTVQCSLDALSRGDHVNVFGHDYIITESTWYKSLGKATVEAEEVTNNN